MVHRGLAAPRVSTPPYIIAFWTALGTAAILRCACGPPGSRRALTDCKAVGALELALLCQAVITSHDRPRHYAENGLDGCGAGCRPGKLLAYRARLSCKSRMPRTGSRQAFSCELSWCIASRARGRLCCQHGQSSASARASSPWQRPVTAIRKAGIKKAFRAPAVLVHALAPSLFSVPNRAAICSS